jgi:hypothetical protein
MSDDRRVVSGVVRNGVVVPRGDAVLPEGADVEIVLAPSQSPEAGEARPPTDGAGSEVEAWEREE